ncbi:hypothetical protein ACROYT_G042267 [Oculina patagonica]
MGKDRPVFDASSEDRRRAFKFFIANFRDYCIMEDYINPAKAVDSDDYWIPAKRPKVWRLFDELSLRPNGMYLPQPSTPKSPMKINNIRPNAVDDRLQRDIFVIGLNDTFKQFRSDLISRENLASLTFEQVINKARDFEAGLKTESAITKQQLEESVHQLTPSVSNEDTTDAAHKVTPNAIKSRPPRRPFRQRGFPASQSHASPTCLWCGRTPHAARRDCPAANDTCHGCGKRGHWKQVCQASAANTVYQADTGFSQALLMSSPRHSTGSVCTQGNLC